MAAGGYDNPSQMKAEDLQENFISHVVGQLQTVQVLEPLLKNGSVIMNVSSALGSCGLKRGGDMFVPYSIAKVSLALERSFF